MTIVRGFMAVLAAVLVTGIIGAAYDYLRPGAPLNPDGMKFLYPWITGLSGGLGGFIAVLVFGAGAARTKTERPAARPQPAHQPARQTTPQLRVPAKPASTATSAEVPGMPTFDFDKTKVEADKLKDKQ